MANTKIDRIKLNGSDTVYDIDLPTDATPNISSLTVSGIKNAAMVSTDANGKLTKSDLPDTFEQISVVEATLQYNDNIEVTEVYLQCEGMESSYRWSKIVFSAPGSYAASNIKYYYNYMGQKTELTPTNASALNSTLQNFGEPIAVDISNDDSNPTITYLPHGMVLDRCYCSTDEGRTKITYYSYNALTGMPMLHEIAPDTSTFLDKGTSSTVVNQVVYNPVEMKNVLTVPSIRGETVTIGGDEIYRFRVMALRPASDGNVASALELTGYNSGATTYTSTRMTQKESSFNIQSRQGKNRSPIFGYDWNLAAWNIEGSAILTEGDISSISSESILSICI